MPRVQTSTAGKIVDFFRSAPMEVAEFAAGQVNDILRERRAKSKAAKDRAAGTKPTATASAAPKAAVKKATKKKSHKKKTPAAPAPMAAAATVTDTAADNIGGADAGEAGDAPELVGATR